MAFGLSGLPGRLGAPYYKQNAFDLAVFDLAFRGSLVDPGPLTICTMLLIWWLLASRGSPVDPGPLTISKMLLIWWLLASRGSLVDPGPLTICKMLLIWWLLASRGSPVDPGPRGFWPLGAPRSTRVPLLCVKCF